MFGISRKEPEFKFNLGDVAKDKITGFEGVIIGRHQWLNNCNTYSIKPRTLKDGAPQDSQSFDEPQLDLAEEKVIESNRKTGGPERKVPQPNRL